MTLNQNRFGSIQIHLAQQTKTACLIIPRPWTLPHCTFSLLNFLDIVMDGPYRTARQSSPASTDDPCSHARDNRFRVCGLGVE